MQVPQVAQLLEALRSALGTGGHLGVQKRDLHVLIVVAGGSAVGPSEPALPHELADPVSPRDRGRGPIRLADFSGERCARCRRATAGKVLGGFRVPLGSSGPVARWELRRVLVCVLAWVPVGRLDGAWFHEDRDYRRGWRADRL